MLGDHGYYRKCEPYEGSANIPFILAASEGMGFKAGTRIDRPVSLQDIMPTLLELAQVPCPKSSLIWTRTPAKSMISRQSPLTGRCWRSGGRSS